MTDERYGENGLQRFADRWPSPFRRLTLGLPPSSPCAESRRDERYRMCMAEAGFPDYYDPPGPEWRPFAPPAYAGPKFDQAVAMARRLVEGNEQ